MVAPVVVARTTSEQSTDSNLFTVGLGSPVAGELIVAVVSIDASFGAVWDIDRSFSGKNWWIAHAVLSSSSVIGIVAIKVADGSDALRFVAVESPAQQASAITFRISGHGSYAAVAVASGTSTNADPPNVAITGSAQDCLFIAAMCADAQVVASSAPSTYGSLTTRTATTSAGASVSVAEKAVNAASDNPGTFTSASEQWVAFTIAIPENNITTNARTTQAALETASIVDPNLIASQVALEVVSSNSLNMIVTQVALELISTNVPDDVAPGNGNKYRMIQIAC